MNTYIHPCLNKSNYLQNKSDSTTNYSKLKEIVKTSNMTFPVKYTFQIDSFNTCDRFVRKVKETLFELDDVLVVAVNANNGEVTVISTSQSPEGIKSALEGAFPTKQIFLLQEIIHQDPPSTLYTQQTPDQSSFDLSSVARSLPIASDHVDGLQNVEIECSRINQSSTSSSGSIVNNTTPAQSSLNIQQSENYSWIYKIEEIDDD
ncbi:unnamed protein product [Lactuca saligna]|uniref:HMA domain-containing protein n=1 Tax=Lactuca saligna TaxID=75948 RepID=A0AA35YGM1_LACSI|nr:unnamed protein product [Lactuca saligna]